MPLNGASLDHVEVWLFDLDNTLYPASCRLFDQIDLRMGAFITDLLGCDAAAARRVQKGLFHRYGTTMRGLMTEHGLDPETFLAFVHDIDVSRVPPSPGLEGALARLGGRKLVFTNGSTSHAERVIARLGVARHIDAIFDIADAGYLPKPHPKTYAALLARHEIDPRSAAMVEDIARNLAPAAALGMTTVWVQSDNAWGREGSDGVRIDHVIDDLAEWLEVRGDEPGPLFWPSPGRGRPHVNGRMTGQAVMLLLRKRAAEAKFAPLTPHDFRRTFIGDLLDDGADMSTVKDLAGHANVNTTARYDRRGEETKRKAAQLLLVPFKKRPKESNPQPD